MRSSRAALAIGAGVVLGIGARGVAQTPAAPSGCRPQHLRLYVYTSPHVRPRHAAVVQKALERRAQVHSSGFQERDGAPVLALGPVRERVFHWRWRDGAWDRNTSMPVAWPFAAVLEYDGDGAPRAWIDWFRRAKGSRDGGAWTKDPADQRYARHIGDAYATDHDDRFCYLAIVDTPTGGVVAGNEWVVRGRVEWGAAVAGEVVGRPIAKAAGIQVWFEPRGDDSALWVAEQVPLVGWVPRLAPGGAGAAAGVVALEPAPDRLAVAGTTTVFTLPPIPPDVVPARGRPAADGSATARAASPGTAGRADPAAARGAPRTP